MMGSGRRPTGYRGYAIDRYPELARQEAKENPKITTFLSGDEVISRKELVVWVLEKQKEIEKKELWMKTQSDMDDFQITASIMESNRANNWRELVAKIKEAQK